MVGLSSSASAPEWIVESVLAHLKTLRPRRGRGGARGRRGRALPAAARSRLGLDRMTRIASLVADRQPTISYEFFPPKDDDTERLLEKSLLKLLPLEPTFVSVTYGALGSTTRAHTRHRREPDAEQSVPDDAASDLRRTLARKTSSNCSTRIAPPAIDNVLALGGDPPADGSDPGGEFAYANELVNVVRGGRWVRDRRGRAARRPSAQRRPRGRSSLPRREAGAAPTSRSPTSSGRSSTTPGSMDRPRCARVRQAGDPGGLPVHQRPRGDSGCRR